MDRVKEIALILIAAALVGEFSLSHLWPAVYFQSTKAGYYKSAVACHRANESFQNAKTTPENSDPILKRKLISASKVELSSCNDYEILKNKLISNGVDQSKLKVVHLEALKNKDLSLSTLVSFYEK
jgi:hypothetical protein